MPVTCVEGFKRLRLRELYSADLVINLTTFIILKNRNGRIGREFLVKALTSALEHDKKVVLLY